MDPETAVYEGEPEMTTNTETMEGEIHRGIIRKYN